jgi:hypothetical protein
MGVLGPGRAWQTYDVTTHADGSASVHIRTADTLGEGDVILEFPVWRRASSTVLNSRGVVVTVTLDGREYVA